MEIKSDSPNSGKKQFVFTRTNFYNICRICFSNAKESLHDLGVSTYDNEILQSVFDSLFTQTGSSAFDRLPPNICTNCVKAMLQYRSFRDQLKQSNRMLKLVYDYLFNDSTENNGRRKDKIISIEHEYYPTADDMLNRCTLVESRCSIDPLAIKTESRHHHHDYPDDSFNLKVVQPVSDDVPSVIFNETDTGLPLTTCGSSNTSDHQHHSMDIPDIPALRQFADDSSQNQQCFSISVDDDDEKTNLLERIMQVTGSMSSVSKKRQSPVTLSQSLIANTSATTTHSSSNTNSSSSSSHSPLPVKRPRTEPTHAVRERKAARFTPWKPGIGTNHKSGTVSLLVKQKPNSHSQQRKQQIQAAQLEIVQHRIDDELDLLHMDDIVIKEEEITTSFDDDCIITDAVAPYGDDFSLFNLLNTAPKAPKLLPVTSHSTKKKPSKRWNCTRCDRFFLKYKSYLLHMERMHVDAFTCRLCHSSFPSNSLYERHDCKMVGD